MREAFALTICVKVNMSLITLNLEYLKLKAKLNGEREKQGHTVPKSFKGKKGN